MHKLKIDIVSDVVCPWCVIGFKNLQKAMIELQKEIEFEINWKPYELHPEIPENGYDKNLKDWFKLIYEVVFGDENGPRISFFISFFGLKETIELINDRIN